MKVARTLAPILILSGFAAGIALFGPAVAPAFGAALALNLFYSFFARNVPYLELIANSATHPVRFLLGILLTGRAAPVLHLVAYFFFIFGFVCLRRELEKDVVGWEARRTLKIYGPRDLRVLEFVSLAVILGCCIADGLVSKGFYAAIIGTYVVLLPGAHVSPSLRYLLRQVWTR